MIDRELSRRSFLTGSLAFSGMALLPGVAQAGNPLLDFGRQLFGRDTKAISLYHTHTGEKSTDIVYWENGSFVDDGVTEVRYMLRDWRTDEIYNMDFDLLAQLHRIEMTLRRAGIKTGNYNIISGYRGAKTNAMLRGRSNGGVAKKSLHMQGKAVDINLDGAALRDLQKAALNMKAGGVGYYPGSHFVHIDTGRVRRWG